MLSIKIEFLLIFDKSCRIFSSIWYSTYFCINLLISRIIKWRSDPFKLWNITGSFLANLRLILQFQWAELLYFPVTWSWSLTLLFPVANNLFHIQHLLLDLKLLFTTADKIFIKKFFITFLQYSFSLRTAPINLLNAFFPL